MDRFTSSFSDLEIGFKSRGIPVDQVGFCDHPAFLTVERPNPTYLDSYARFVQQRHYDEAYISRARAEISAMAIALHGELVNSRRQGGCVDAASMLAKMLDREGYWNYVVKGSLTIEYPKASRIPRQYFYMWDTGDFAAGHAWIYAPPFAVVDITVRQQGHSAREFQLLPDYVLAEDPESALATADDMIAPLIKAQLSSHGVKKLEMFREIGPDIQRFLDAFPACEVNSGGTRLKYLPAGIGGATEALEEITGFTKGGRRALAIYKDVVIKALKYSRLDREGPDGSAEDETHGGNRHLKPG